MNLNDALEIFPDAHVTSVDPGDGVFCDLCDKDYTNLPDSGGLLFLSNGVCPECAPSIEKSAAEAGELEHIRGRCPEGVSFADWMRTVRASHNIAECLWELTMQTADEKGVPPEITLDRKPAFMLGLCAVSEALLGAIERGAIQPNNVESVLKGLQAGALQWARQLKEAEEGRLR